MATTKKNSIKILSHTLRDFSKNFKYTLVVCLGLFNKTAFSQLSNIHYIPPITSAYTSIVTPEDQYIYISTPNINNVSFTIKPLGALPSGYITGNVSADKHFEYFIGNDETQLYQKPSDTKKITNNKGFIVEASSNIYVSVRLRAGGTIPSTGLPNYNQAGALVSKGNSALGTRFRLGTFDNQGQLTINHLNFVSVMATEDNTLVRFSDLKAGMIIENHNGGNPILAGDDISVALNKGGSYILAVDCSKIRDSFGEIIPRNPNTDGLIGALVRSTKPIVVNVGSSNGSFKEDPDISNNTRDFGIDQIVDVSKVGTEYIFVKGSGENSFENILLVADTNNTEIFLKDNPIAVKTIDAGEYYIIEGDQYTSPNDNLYVRTTEPVFAYQGIGGTANSANQGMFFVPPLSCEATGDLSYIANIDKIGPATFTGVVTIITEGSTIGAANIKVYEKEGTNPEELVDLSGPETKGPFNVLGKSGYVTYKISGLSGNIRVDGTGELYVAYYNFNNAATSGSFYAGFPVAPDIVFDPDISNLSYCIPNATLEAKNIEGFDSFEFQLLDPITGNFSSVKSVTVTNPIDPSAPFYKPDEPGTYRIQGKLACSLINLESASVFISRCPGDFDKDNIIDNIDIDDDNDGITDCSESLGDGILDLTSGNESILIGSTTIPVAGTTLSTTSPNIFSASNTGEVLSALANGTTNENEYEINFSNPVNIKFSQTRAIAPSLTEEYFIVRIAPDTKNITLFDPDDQLLVDTNTDGAFESGVTLFSASEIHFKVNAAPTGNKPFEFNAKRIDNISFFHKTSEALSSASQPFVAKLSVTCYAKDTDNDGVTDDIDLDSDNDGIPDKIENIGQNVTLLQTDNNKDGLDDVFESGLVDTLKDTDGDGIPDFYDLDSDNDGIFDLIESVSDTNTQVTFPDSDNNGVIDNVLSDKNGWYDPAESAPDSSIIGYSIRDVDADGIFNYLDSDSDNDGCYDVIEAGFTDSNNDAFLGNSSPVVDTQGMVTNRVDGYTTPTTIDYLIFAEINIEQEPEATLDKCAGENTSLKVNTDVPGTYQWEVNMGSSWTPIMDNLNYSGATTTNLKITNIPKSFNLNQYRVIIQIQHNTCIRKESQITLLNVFPNTGTIIPLPALERCDDDPSTPDVAVFNITYGSLNRINNTANNTITYYETRTEAENAATTGIISNITAFESRIPVAPNLHDIVWIRSQPDVGCATIYSQELIVNPPALAYPISTLTECEVVDEIAIFSLDIADIKAQVLNTQNNLDVFFSYINENGDLLTDQTSLPSTLLSKDQSIAVKVVNSNDDKCFDLETLELKVVSKPKFTVQSTYEICLTTLETVNLTVQGITNTSNFFYNWSFSPNTETTPLAPISNNESVIASEAGIYTITLTDITNPYACKHTETIVVHGIETANFNDNAITIVELSDEDNNSVRINRSLIGPNTTTYEYALVETMEDEIPLPPSDFEYQSDVYFPDVAPGLYTVFVKDINDVCPIFTWEITVLGIPKYFTPNGDTIHDTWTIKGINKKKYPSTELYVFDRQGKLLKHLNLEPGEPGWDGTYNGTQLPTDDYWYKLYLNDGRRKSGHFTLRR